MSTLGAQARRDWRLVVLAMVLGTAGGSAAPILAPNWVRPDPFKGVDSRLLEARLEANVEKRMAILEYKLKRTLPPGPTRDRIRALEEQMRKIIPSYLPPTERFVLVDPALVDGP